MRQINEDLTNVWMKKSSFSSHVEGYLCATQDKEISTASLKAKISRSGEENPNCWLCKNNREMIQHVVAAHPKLSASMYLPLDISVQCCVRKNYQYTLTMRHMSSMSGWMLK